MASGKDNGRPRIEINYAELEKLCEIQCTIEEIAQWFRCSVDTIERRIKERYQQTFAEYFSKKRATGLISLRRTQFKMAENNVSMAIFLGKNYLGQTDQYGIDPNTSPPPNITLAPSGPRKEKHGTDSNETN